MGVQQLKIIPVLIIVAMMAFSVRLVDFTLGVTSLSGSAMAADEKPEMMAEEKEDKQEMDMLAAIDKEEETLEKDVSLFDHRLSTYLSGGFQITETFNINHVTYFQPNLEDFSDFRVSSETSFSLKISEKLAFRTYFQLVYDRRPPIPVPNLMYTLNNGLEIAL